MKKVITLTTLICMLTLISACSTMKSTSDADEAHDKKVAEINIQLGMAYLGRGDVQRAKQKFLYAQQKAPNLPEVWYSMAYFLQETGNQAQAQDYYLKAVQLAPNRGDVLNNYGTFLCRIGKYPEAVHYFISATQDQEYLNTAGAYENAGLCALKIPDHAKAIAYFNKALESDPSRSVSIAELNKLKKS